MELEIPDLHRYLLKSNDVSFDPGSVMELEVQYFSLSRAMLGFVGIMPIQAITELGFDSSIVLI